MKARPVTDPAIKKRIAEAEARGVSRQRISQLRYPEHAAANRAAPRRSAPGKCEECGETRKLHGHHDDYSKPKQVRWLCGRCHAEFHAALRRAEPREPRPPKPEPAPPGPPTVPLRRLVDCPRCGSRKTLSVLSGEWIAQRRQELRKTQTELADEIGIEQATLSRIENGHQIALPETAEKLGRALGFQP